MLKSPSATYCQTVFPVAGSIANTWFRDEQKRRLTANRISLSLHSALLEKCWIICGMER